MSDPSQPRLAAWITGWTAFAVALILALTIGTLAWRWASAPARGKVGAREQIQSAGSRIAAYDHFFNLCAAVQSQEAALDAQYAELDGSTGDERDRIRANIAGLTAQRGRSIAQYNADARKDYTIGQFRSSDLPYQLVPSAYTNGATTSCER